MSLILPSMWSMDCLVVKVLKKIISLICFRVYLEVIVFKNPTCFSRWSVRCNSCSHKGIIDKNCPKCGGKGIHNKTIKVYKVAKHTVDIVRIDRASKDSYYKEELLTSEGELRYWEDLSHYYSEHTKLLHFTKEDAQRECNRRNKDIQHILDLYENNKVVENKDNVDYKVGDKFIVPKLQEVVLKDGNFDTEIYKNCVGVITKIFCDIDIEKTYTLEITIDKINSKKYLYVHKGYLNTLEKYENNEM